jgi:hypothetical protein
MSRIFKRPMFRKGGPTNGMTGIMSGIQDRENFQQGSARERLEKIYEEYPTQTVDPLSQFLIQGGLNLMSATPRGGTLATAAEAFKEPTAGLLQGLGAKEKEKRKIALEGEILDIEAERALALAKEKNKQKDFFASQTPEAQFEVLTDLYSDSKIPVIKNNAYNLAEFEVSMRKSPESYTQLGFEYGTVPGTKKKDYVPSWGSIPVGNVTYNPSTGLAYKRITRENNNASDFIPLNPSTLQPLE